MAIVTCDDGSSRRGGHAVTSQSDITVDQVAEIEVNQYGRLIPLQQAARLHQEGDELIAEPYDPSQMSAIEQAVRRAQPDLTATNDGSVIHITRKR
jgi:ribosome recycling factor